MSINGVVLCQQHWHLRSMPETLFYALGKPWARILPVQRLIAVPTSILVIVDTHGAPQDVLCRRSKCRAHQRQPLPALRGIPRGRIIWINV